MPYGIIIPQGLREKYHYTGTYRGIAGLHPGESWSHHGKP